jgi:hypothetical protein
MENTTFVADGELNEYISASYAELHDLLTQSGISFWEGTHTFSTTGASSYSLPSDFCWPIMVVYKDGTSQAYEVEMVDIERMTRIKNMTDTTYPLGYRIVNSGTSEAIHVYPTGNSGASITLYYIPCPDDLTDDADVINGVSGWEEYIVVDAAIKCLEKEESNTGHLMARKQQLLQRIEQMKEKREMHMGRAVIDKDDRYADPLFRS